MTPKTLLLVEDEQSIAGSLIEYLRRERFEIKHCATFESAKAFSLDDISLVLLDWMLPD